MTRRLMLLRHAQAAAQAAGDDAARPLTEAGHHEARLIGQAMASHDFQPDAAIVSPALRAQQTLADVTAASGYACPTQTLPRLYGASVDGLLEAVRGVAPSIASLLVVGHNPTMADTLQQLAGGSHALAFPTAGLAVFDVDGDAWADLAEATLVRFLMPAELARPAS